MVNHYFNLSNGHTTAEALARLNLVKTITESESYYYGVAGIPQETLAVAAKGTVEGHIDIPPNTFITAIMGYSSQPEGFALQIFDNGTKSRLFNNGLGFSYSDAGAMDADPANDVPQQINWLESPLIVLKPGRLNWTIVNMSASAATIQVALYLATPINAESIDQNVISTRDAA